MARARELSVCVLTGAGASADSGLAVFRGKGGLWEERRIEDVATPEAWARDPRGVWRFYQERRAALPGARPNAAHLALAELERRLGRAGASFTLATQNVDDLHERAGSRGVLHVHGELRRLACEECGYDAVDLEHLDPERFVPCPECGLERLRPDVVWFGEVPHFLEELEGAVLRATHFLALGTSGAVWPAAGFLQNARLAGAATVVQALEPPDNLDPADRFLRGRAAEVVPPLVEELCAEWGCPA